MSVADDSRASDSVASEDALAGPQDQITLPVMHHLDARTIRSIIDGLEIHLTLTSPPYFDVKDYGQDAQIGYGQDYQSYLDDLTAIFSDIHAATHETGSLWIVIDSFRRGGELIPLPFDLGARLRAAGWKLKDVIIWRKDRTLPWLTGRPTRSIYEYIMVFAKNADRMMFHPDRVRDHRDLRQWWIKYPERYNPNGKSIEELWDIPIPVQGSWGKSTPRHMCPLPSALVTRVLRLTTDVGDLVLDPFAGTGVVLSEAHRLGRRAIGCEIDSGLAEEFRVRQSASAQSVIADNEDVGMDAGQFKRTITELRILKFARLLLQTVRRRLGIDGGWIYASPSKRTLRRPFSIAAADFVLVAEAATDVQPMLAAANEAAGKKPLSKFGLDFSIRAIRPGDLILDDLAHETELYSYTLANSHRFKCRVARDSLRLSAPPFPVVSSIGVMLDEQSDF